MKDEIIIYGAGNTGRAAYAVLGGNTKCLFFVDKDETKWGGVLEGKEICSPERLKEYKNTQLVIASVYYKEILEEIKDYEMMDVLVYKNVLEPQLSEKIRKQLDNRTIDLGSLYDKKIINLKELTYISGGSGVLDYAFLKTIAELFYCRKYLEIGSYIGESLNVLTDCCEELYSITLPADSIYSVTNYCKRMELPDYSNRLSYSPKIQHYYADSKQFDYSLLPDDIDLFFIDGDHSYEGVYSDTKNIYNIKKENAIIIWHDFKIGDVYRAEVINAVRDALGKEFENVYVTNNNICGIYLPKQYQDEFVLKEKKYETDAALYTYNTTLKCINK